MGALALVRYLAGALVEPALQVEPGRCLRTSGADCRACVDLCPVQALSLSAPQGWSAPHAELTRCTDCGLCAAGCPSGALTGVGVPDGSLPRQASRQEAMTVACAPARREAAGTGQERSFPVSCLGALHPETVVGTALAMPAGATLTLARAQCSECPSAQQARVEAVVGESVRLLQHLDDGGRGIAVSELGANAGATAARSRRPVERVGWSRRELLIGRRDGRAPSGRREVTPARADLLGNSPDPGWTTQRLTRPVLAEGCTLCRACVQVCPTQALRVGRLPSDDTGTDAPASRVALAVDPRQCLGCGRCAQVCVDDVLTLAAAPVAPPHARRAGRLVVLAEAEDARCASCEQPLGPGERAVCHGCLSARSLTGEVLAYPPAR